MTRHPLFNCWLFVLGGMIPALTFGESPVAGTDLTVVGAAKIDITPSFPVRLSGYGNRRAEADKTAQKLWAKAIAIGNQDNGGPSVLITYENCGLTPEIRDAVAKQLQEKAGVKNDRLVITVSHTHTAPCLTNWAPFLFGEDIPPEHQKHIDEYTQQLTDKLVIVALEALKSRRIAWLSWGQGEVGFAANRRMLKDGLWTGFGVQHDGPVDHSLPVLAARDTDGKLIAVVANYACHCTTLGSDYNQIAGDWLGYAQEYIEADHPGAVALITIGCGADANPEPRGSKLELCQQHGRALADEVKRLLVSELVPLDSKLDCRLRHVDLSFDTLPTKEQWQERAKQAGAPGYHAEQFLALLERGEEIPQTYSYPVATWTFGKDLAIVFLGGEVVVDYAIRMKGEFDASRLWITAYANDVPCYIASQRVLREGGYEADFSMYFYARPTRWATSVEDTIVDTVQKLLPQFFYAAPKAADFPPPKSPQESLASIQEKPGYKVELVASEPLIEDPVAFDWGPDGRLWVVEMRDYPNGLDWDGSEDKRNTPGGRVKVLSDIDGDGRFDKADLFLDDIPFPTGVKVWRKGVLISAAPLIFYAEDTDGDGRADKRETLYEGFGEGNQQHRVNGLRWGLDNWLYVGNGDSGGNIKSLKTGTVVNVSGRDLRIRPDTGEIDPQSGQTQFGRCRDDWGNWFGGNNANPMWHYVLEDHYLRRNPHVAPPDVRKQVSVQPGASPVFPASKTLTRFNDFNMTNRFTSACSPEVYRDELLFSPALQHVFICEPVHNLVHHEIMTADGVTFTSRRADDEQQREFLASADNWFRPAMCRTGPDGALWVADMYRAVIEHPEWIPKDWQRKLDLRAGSNMGRIYRVVPTDAAPRKPWRLDRLDDARLVAALDSPNGWQRDMAQQMLLWRFRGQGLVVIQETPQSEGSARGVVVAALENLAATSKRPQARLHAICTLDGLRALRAEVVLSAMNDEHPGVRRHAIRLAESFVSGAEVNADVRKALLHRYDDVDPQVRLQLAYSVGAEADPLSGRLLAILAKQGSKDPYMAAAILSSVRADNVGHVLECLSPTVREDSSNGFFERLIGVAAALGDERSLTLVINQVTRDDHGRYAAWQFATLAELIEACQRKNLQLDKRLDDEARKQVVRSLDVARATATSAEAPEADRIAALRLLGRGPNHLDEDVAILVGMLTPQYSFVLQSAAVTALGKLNQNYEDTAALLLAGWDSYSPNLRCQILDLLLSRAEWTRELLAAMERGVVPPAQIDATRRQRLLSAKQDEARKLAEKLFSSSVDRSRQKVLDDHKSVLTLAGDVPRGKAIFTKRCEVCHRFDGSGHAVGPDLAAVAGKSTDVLLAAMLDPSRAIEDRYRNYMVVTVDGQILAGMLATETGASITLLAQEGKEITVLRNEIEELRSSGKSLMPEGFEKDMSPQDFADVIAYLRSSGPPPKPFPGNNPEAVRVGDDGALRLLATTARIYGPKIVFEEKYRNLGWWSSPDDYAVWSLDVPAAGEYRAVLDYACDNSAAGDKLLLSVAGQSIGDAVEGTGSWDDYRTKEIGVVKLLAGPAELVVRSDGPINTALIDLRGVRLMLMKK